MALAEQTHGGWFNRAWSWLVTGLTEPPATIALAPAYLMRVAYYRWGLLAVYATSLALMDSVLGLAWDLAALGFVGSNTVAYAIHTFAAGRRGALYRWFWWIAPFADLVAISLIMATVSPAIFLAWGIAILPLSFFTAALSWRGSYMMVLRAVAAAGFGGAVIAHAEAGFAIQTEEIAVAALLVMVGSWVTARTAVEQRILMSRLESQSLTDSLTGLANRRALAQEMSQPLIGALSRGRGLAVMVVDLDNFKGVNDAHGHDVGDSRLCQVAEVFRANVRKEDVVYRYGGDEFVVLAPVAGDGEASTLAGRLQESVHAQTDTRLSIGYALVSADAPDLSESLKLADQALLEAKRRGKGCVVSALELDAALSKA